MSDKKISELSSASSLNNSDLLVLVNEDQTKKTTLNSLRSFVNSEDYIETTYFDLADLKAGENLATDALYFMTERNIWLRALSPSQLSPTGDYLLICAKYESIGSDITGVWGNIITYGTDDRVIYNNFVWKSLADANIGNIPDDEGSEFWVIEVSTNATYYKKELYECEFDFENNWIQLVHDVKRNNKIGNSYAITVANEYPENVIAYFPWGYDSVYSIESINAWIDLRNSLLGSGSISFCRLEQSASFISFRHYGTSAVSNLIIRSNGVLDSITIENDAIFTNITIGSAGNLGHKHFTGSGGASNLFVNSSITNSEVTSEILFSNNRIEPGYSDAIVSIDLDSAGVYISGTQTLTIPTAKFKYAGIIILNGTAPSYSIESIVNIPTSWPVQFKTATEDIIITFVHTPIVSISTNKIVMEEPKDFVLNGFANSISDALTLRKQSLGILQVAHSSIWTDQETTLQGDLSDGDIPYFDGTLLQASALTFDSANSAIRLNQDNLLASYATDKTQIDFGDDGDNFIVTTDGATALSSSLSIDPLKVSLTGVSLALLSADHGDIRIGTSNIDIAHDTKIGFDAPDYNFAQLTASTVPYIDSSSNLVSSSVTPTELGYVHGVTSGIQAQLDALVGGMQYQGVWNANTNSPALVNGTGTKGYFYKVSVAGTTTIDSNTNWHVGDWIAFDGTVWDKIDNYIDVSSVFGRTGAITAQSGDYNTSLVTENTNLYFTNARAIASTLTGYTSGAGTLSSSDSVLSAIQKLNGNVGALVTGVSAVFGRTGSITATSGDYNTSLVTENTNLYFTNARAQAAISNTATGLTYTSATGVLSLTSGYVIISTAHDTNLSSSAVGVTLDGNGGVIAVSSTVTLVIPYSGTITGWEILETSSTPVSSSIVVDVWKDTYANYPPTVGDAVFTTLPTLSSATKNQNLSPTFVGSGAVTAGDIMKFNVNSVTSALKVQVILFITRS
jgi:hypothetical protein